MYHRLTFRGGPEPCGPVAGVRRRQPHNLAPFWRQLPHDFPFQPPQHHLLQGVTSYHCSGAHMLIHSRMKGCRLTPTK